MKSDWAKLLDETLAERADKIEPGFLTSHQIAAEWQKNADHTRKLLGDMVVSGKVERKYFRVATKSGLKNMPYYRPRASGGRSQSA